MRITLATSVTSSLSSKVEHAEMVANATVSLIQGSGLPSLSGTQLLANASDLLPSFYNSLFSTTKGNSWLFFISIAASRPYVSAARSQALTLALILTLTLLLP